MNRIFRLCLNFFCRSHSNAVMIIWPSEQLRSAVAPIHGSRNRESARAMLFPVFVSRLACLPVFTLLYSCVAAHSILLPRQPPLV